MSTVAAFPTSAHTARRMAGSLFTAAIREMQDAERDRADVVLRLTAGGIDLSLAGKSNGAVIREANARVFAARCRVDELVLRYCAEERHDLTPNDESDMEDALRHRLRENEAAADADDAGSFTRLTPACVGVTTRR